MIRMEQMIEIPKPPLEPLRLLYHLLREQMIILRLPTYGRVYSEKNMLMLLDSIFHDR